nr:lytic transglycosylase domain-containing protein [Colidextribacter sp. OB.20]
MWGRTKKVLLKLCRLNGEGECPASQADKRCGAALLGLLAAITVCYELTDGAALQEVRQEDKPSVEIIWEAPISQPRLLEAVKLQLEPDPYREDVPLERELQAALRATCEENGVPVALALGLIEEESQFQPDVVSHRGAYGLCQLNPKYFPRELTPAENIAAGVGYLGELLERHGDTASALRAYNLGYDDGDRKFADAVLAAAEKWEKD